MHITITGNLGSGKSTICKILEDKYGFSIYSTGKVQRELAREMNLTTLEMNKLMCSDPKYDTMIDDTTARISRENKGKKIIFDSRLAWNFVEQSFKVFLQVSLDVAANRVINDNRGKEETYKSLDEAKALLKERAQTEDRRYKDMYNVEYFNYSNYNLVIDSTYSTPEVIAAIIMEEAKNFYDGLASFEGDFKDFHYQKVLISPKRLSENEISEFDILQDNIVKDDKTTIKSVTNITSNYYIGDHIIIKKEDESLLLLQGLDEVKQAIKNNVPYVLVKLNS